MTLLIQPERKLHGTYGRPKLERQAIIRPDLVLPLRQRKIAFMRDAIESAMILCGGNRTLAAERLEISREALYKWIKVLKRDD